MESQLEVFFENFQKNKIFLELRGYESEAEEIFQFTAQLTPLGECNDNIAEFKQLARKRHKQLPELSEIIEGIVNKEGIM
ncbi:MAG: hypothetical protein ACOYNC_00985 [Bacteroidales bacterium]